MRQALIVLAALWLVACSSPGTADGPVEVELDEFYIEPAAGEIASGDVVFDVFNEGDFPHTLVVAHNNGEVVFASDVVAPGGTVELNLNLAPDTYQLTCRIVVELEGGELVDHYQNGMGATIEVKP